MKISVNVPTYKRAGMIETFALMPSATFWVHKFETKEYQKAHKGIRIAVLPDETRGNIARVRNFILKKTAGDDACLMMDDDVLHVARWEKRERIRLNGEKAILSMVERYSRIAQEWGVKLWGINVNNDKQVYREYSPFSTLSYISASFSVFLKGNDIFYDERFSLKEDYDMTIQQLNVYRRVLRVNKFYYMKKGAEQIGGCAAYRNVAKEVAQIEALQKKWGRGIVKFDGNKRNHLTTKNRSFDINPVITVPISGI